MGSRMRGRLRQKSTTSGGCGFGEAQVPASALPRVWPALRQEMLITVLEMSQIVFVVKRCVSRPGVERDIAKTPAPGNRTLSEFALPSNVEPAPAQQFFDPLTPL